MQEVKYKVEYVEVSKLKTHPENPRFIKDEAFEILCQSIKDNPHYFEARPVICDKNYIIWAGNQRYRAGKHIGMKAVPTVVLDIPEAQLREIMIRDNVSNGDWDTGLLASLYSNSELEKWGLDLSQFGVDTSEDEKPDELTADKSDNKPTIKLTFQSVEDLENAKVEIESVISRYAGALLSVSAGEL